MIRTYLVFLSLAFANGLARTDNIKLKDHIGHGKVVSVAKGFVELEAPPRTEILVAGAKKTGYPPDSVALKANLEEVKKARIEKLVGDKRKPATLADIKVGQILEVTWDGVIRTSEPPLIKPASILICDGRFHLEGTIALVKPDRKGVRGTVRIDGIRNKKTSPSVLVNVFPKTAIAKLADGKRRPIFTWDEIKVGQRVRVLLSGPIWTVNFQEHGDGWDILIVDKGKPDR